MSQSKKKLLVMAGGTGGHIFPALAVADDLKAQGWQICWLGTPGRMEANLVPEHGYHIEFIDVVGVRGNGLKRLFLAPFMVMRSIIQALKVIGQFKPDVVVGFGGFASGPGGIAAWLKRIPLVLHEQNAIAGFTNKVLARFATKVLMAFPGTFAPNKADLVGNPVRKSIVDLAMQPPTVMRDDELNVLIVGGSLGALVLNQELPKLLPRIASEKVKINIHHQTGKSRNGGDNVAQVKAAYAHVMEQQSGKIADLVVNEFIEDMAKAYQWADLVICRAGALTVAEVAASGTAAVFVPFPHAVDDHQTLNAKWLADGGAAYIVQQAQLDSAQTEQLLAKLLTQPSHAHEMGLKARDIAILNATERVAGECKHLV